MEKKEIKNQPVRGLKILFVASWPPKQCGIGTYTKDVRDAIASYDNFTLAYAVAINDVRKKYDYGMEVKCEIDQEDLNSLDRTIRYINESGADVLNIQHEFGIWGGFDGEFISYFIKKIKVPVVTTFHTIPLVKTARRRENRIRLIKLMAKYSKKVVVIAEEAKKQLSGEYKIPANKIEIIPHGAPDVAFLDPEQVKQEIGLSGKKVISTFGLINVDKGLEFVIEAMTKVVIKNPNVVYRILGEPHPTSLVAKKYYETLKEKVKKLNLENNVIFINKYLTLQEVIKNLQATDIYITPYLAPAQTSSGTLSYAAAAGKCIIATPFVYAKEVLNGGRGTFIEMRNSDDIVGKINYFFDHPDKIKEKEKLMYAYGRNLVWPKVAEKYFNVFSRARKIRK